jgi:hypothetical protein
MNNQIIKQKFQIIEIDIPGAGSEVNLSKATEADHDEITGVAIFKNGGTHGHGTLGLRIAGDEIFPDSFHAGIVTLDAANKNIVLKDVVWPVSKAGKGSQVIIKYKEPQDGAAGMLYLYLLASKKVYSVAGQDEQ